MLPLETPVLLLAIDAVRKVEGDDALCGLLTLLSKCKEGLEEGPRLENMASRLWYRVRSSACLPSPILCLEASTSASAPNASPIASDFSPPSSSNGEPEDRSDSFPSDSECWETGQPSMVKQDNLVGSLASRRAYSNTNVGNIMAELLPEKLSVCSFRQLTTTPELPYARTMGELASRASPVFSQLKHTMDVVNWDSEYETTDEDEEDWSTDVDAESEREKEQLRQAEATRELERERIQAEAAAAKERCQHELFAKLPRQSYTNLQNRDGSSAGVGRTKSAVGLLSMIFHPPPEWFPTDHPYRRTLSSQDILAGGYGPGIGYWHQQQQQQQRAQRRALSSHGPPPAYAPAPPTRKASAAGPVAATVTVQAVSPTMVRTTLPPDESLNKSRRSPLRLKGPAVDAGVVEFDDDDDEYEENRLHISESVAQQRLAELHQKATAKRRASLNQQQQQQQQQQVGPSQLGQHLRAQGHQQRQQPDQRPRAQFANDLPTREHNPAHPLQHVSTAPMPIMHMFPYFHLPTPQEPTTPRTTRRNFLTHELTESLRRNMLWERQINHQRPLRRAAAASTATEVTDGQSSQHEDPDVRRKEERKQAAVARNKGWAGGFYGDGW